MIIYLPAKSVSIQLGAAVLTTSPPLPSPPDHVTRVISTDLNCNVENGLCVWSQSHTDQMDWTVNSGGTDTPLTGPRSDHTLQNRKFTVNTSPHSPPKRESRKMWLQVEKQMND